MEKKNSKWVKAFDIIILPLTLILLIYFALKESSFDELAEVFSTLKLGWVGVAFFSMCINWFIDGFMIFLFTKAVVKNYKFKNGFKVAMVGQYFNSITPFATGGQPMQILTMTRQGVDGGVACATLIQKFLVWQVVITTTSLTCLIARFNFFNTQIKGFMYFALLGFLVQGFVVFVLLLVSLNKKATDYIFRFFKWICKKFKIKNADKKVNGFEEQITYFHKNIKLMLTNKKNLLLASGLTLLQLCAFQLLPYFVYRAFGLNDASAFDMFAANIFLSLVVSFFPMPGGAGASEGGFLMLFSIFFTNPHTKVTAVLLWRIISFYASIAIGAPFARLSKKKSDL